MAMPVGNDKANNKDDASDRVWRWERRLTLPGKGQRGIGPLLPTQVITDRSLHRGW
jgi:hypothetical protein